MRNLSKSLLGLWLIGMALGVTAPAQAASGVGPYYAMPAWDQTLPAATRFIVLTNMNSEAVLDRETGLVWEQSPGPNIQTWQNTQIDCVQKVVGGRRGWRFPSVQELTSLADPANPGGNPDLPSGHPFTLQIGSPSHYWSATTYATEPLHAWAVNFNGTGLPNHILKTSLIRSWCVRGGQGVDAQ